MTQMNISMKERQTHRHRGQTEADGGQGNVWSGNSGLADASYYIENGWATGSYSIAQGIIFNILW